MMLTIYVPAFERPHELGQLLLSIPARPDVRVIVSDDSGTGALGGVCSAFPVEYQQMRYNLGRDGNVLRALAVDTEWLWVVGDDDWLLPGALDRVLDVIREDDCDRIIGYTRAAVPHIPFTGTVDAPDALEKMRDNPSLLIASTLCSANLYRTDSLDLRMGLAHLDTYYSYAWSTLDCSRWCILDEPTIGVGTEHVQTIPRAVARWSDYLSALCEAQGVPIIPVHEARRWNFTSLEGA